MNLGNHRLAIAASFLLTALSVGVADAKISQGGDSNVTFNAIGPAGMKIVGTTNELALGDDGNALTVTVPLKNLSTGISLRDKHMKEKYLQVGQFPNAELTVGRSSLKIPADGTESTGDTSGTMKLHGKTKNVSFHYSAKRSGAQMQVNGTVRVNMNDFGIEVPSYLGVTVKPDIDIAVKFNANEG